MFNKNGELVTKSYPQSGIIINHKYQNGGNPVDERLENVQRRN
ncbi:MAG: hypothetical protein ACOCRK_10050 [bacterium]